MPRSCAALSKHLTILSAEPKRAPCYVNASAPAKRRDSRRCSPPHPLRALTSVVSVTSGGMSSCELLDRYEYHFRNPQGRPLQPERRSLVCLDRRCRHLS